MDTRQTCTCTLQLQRWCGYCTTSWSEVHNFFVWYWTMWPNKFNTFSLGWVGIPLAASMLQNRVNLAACGVNVAILFLHQHYHLSLSFCRGSMSHLLSGVNRKARQMRATTMLSLWQQHTTWHAFMSLCASLTKEKHCTRTSSGNTPTMLTVSIANPLTNTWHTASC